MCFRGNIEFQFRNFIFRPTLVGILVTLLCIPLFIKFGLWQYHKAEQKQAIQDANKQATIDQAIRFPLEVSNTDDWNYRKVIVHGEYDTKYQFLLDNQVQGGRVGYDVITPLKVENSSEYVLINRGWILAKDTHTDLPTFDTPNGMQTLVGQIWVPSKKIFTLEDKSVSTNIQNFSPVWQNMDMAKYKKSVPFNVSPLAMRLDPASESGFVRDWQMTDDRIATNVGYAYQWFGFAIATLIIFIYMSFTRINPHNQ